MKRKTIILLAVVAMLSFFNARVNADPVEVQLEVGYIDPTYDQEVPHRNPVPEVSIDGYTLIFSTPCDGCLLRIVNEDGGVEYSTIIPTGATTLVLPSYLSGDYELQIISGSYIFYGDITL